MADPDARSDLLGGASAFMASVLFGAIIIWGRHVLAREVPVETMLSIRFFLGAIVLFLALRILRRPLLASPGERVRLGLLGLVGYALESSLFFTASQHGTVAAVALLFFTYPVFVTVLTWVFGKRRPTLLTLVALVCAVGGAVVVVGTGAGLAIDTTGVVLVFATAVTYSAYLTSLDLLLKRSEPLTSAMWLSIGASIGLFVYANALGHWAPPSGIETWGPLVAMGLASGGAFFFLMVALRRIGALRTAIISATEPLAGAVLGFVFLAEVVTLGVAAGGVLILVGAVMASLARAKPREQQIP